MILYVFVIINIDWTNNVCVNCSLFLYREPHLSKSIQQQAATISARLWSKFDIVAKPRNYNVTRRTPAQKAYIVKQAASVTTPMRWLVSPSERREEAPTELFYPRSSQRAVKLDVSRENSVTCRLDGPNDVEDLSQGCTILEKKMKLGYFGFLQYEKNCGRVEKFAKTHRKIYLIFVIWHCTVCDVSITDVHTAMIETLYIVQA